MIDPNDPLDVQVQKQRRIIDALIRRAERRHELGHSAYSLFQSAISLQATVWEKTRDLEDALDSLGQTARDLEAARREQESLQRTLADAMIAIEGGFALFSDRRLQICNTLFRRLLPDVEPMIRPGLDLDAYLEAVHNSRFVSRETETDVGLLADVVPRSSDTHFASSVVPLKNDRWFQISRHAASSNNIVVLLTEITEIVRETRRQKEELIDRHGQFLQIAFDHMSLGLCAFSDAGELQVRNDRFGELLGVPLRLLKRGSAFRRIVEHLGRFDLLDRDDTDHDGEGWLKSILRGQPAQVRFRRSDGMCLDLRVRPFPEGGFVVSIMDITAEADAAVALEQRVRERTAELTEANRLLEQTAAEQARTEEALREAKEDAEDANRSKTRFIAAASHDLLQPINAAKLYISTLREAELTDTARDTVERLGRSFSSIEGLLHAILDISRLDSPGMDFNITSFCIGPLLHNIQTDFAPLAEEKGIRLTVVGCSRWVSSDRRYLSRSIQNLVVNAIQYTDAGRVLLGCRLYRDRVRVEVHDTGIGISEEDQARIFNEFTRVRDAGGGMGLGLSIVDRACRHLGHPLQVTSQPGKGSSFFIELPLAASPAPTLDRPSTDDPALDDAEPGLIALLIENDPEVLHATTQKLESWGITVVAVASTPDAVAIMDDLGTPPDIILADYQLDNGETGLDAVRILRDRAGYEVPAILITANRDKAVLRQAEAMSLPVLAKPVHLARLRSLIDWTTRMALP
ncbi:MAG: PAS-domain containing protein [Rhodobacteraceae bacterium]|nr:PAS-domain containing protein [Paracoccaceae bacterium]